MKRAEIEKEREEVLQKIRAIRSMEPGTLSEQFVERTSRGKKTGEMRGPYYLLSRNIEGKTVSRRVNRKGLERIRADIANYREFTRLCREYVRLTELLGNVERNIHSVFWANEFGDHGPGASVRSQAASKGDIQF